jgi:hypothetical protein
MKLNCDECKMENRCVHKQKACVYPDGRKYGVDRYQKTPMRELAEIRRRLKKAEKIISGYCMCDSEWTPYDKVCAFCKYKRKYLEKED